MLRSALAWGAIVAGSCAPRGVVLDPPQRSMAVEVPADAQQAYARARYAELRGELDTAEADLAWVIRFSRSHPASWVAKAAFLERQGRHEEADAAYRQALVLDPGHGPAQAGLGRLALDDGDLDQALHWLEQAAAAGHPPSMGLVVQLHADRGDRDAASALLERWIHLPVDEPERRGRVALAFRVGRSDLAVDDLLFLLWERPQLPDADALWAAAVSGCRWASLRTWVEQRNVADWGDGWSRWTLRTAQHLGDHELEGRALGAMADTQPLPYAAFLLEHGRVAEARALLAEVATPEARLMEARALHVLGEVASAQGVERAVPAGGPSLEAARVDLLLDWGLVGRAAQILTQREVVDLPWLRARVAAHRGRWSQAQSLLDHWSSPDQAAWRMSDLRLEVGDQQGALEALERAARSGSVLAARRLAQRYPTGDGRALAWWERVRAFDPEDPDALVGIARLDPARRSPLLSAALQRDPCHVPALVETASAAPDCEAVRLLERAHQAAPLDRAAEAALGQARDRCGRGS